MCTRHKLMPGLHAKPAQRAPHPRPHAQPGRHVWLSAGDTCCAQSMRSSSDLMGALSLLGRRAAALHARLPALCSRCLGLRCLPPWVALGSSGALQLALS